MFYQVRSIWNALQDGKITMIIEQLVEKDQNIHEFSRSDQVKIVQRVADLLYTGGNFYYRVILIELICFCHIIFQIYLTDTFLGGQFQHLGLKWLEHNHGYHSAEDNPLQKIFPRQAKCSFQTFGPSGDLAVYDGLCLLLMNNAFEKIYLAIWMTFHFAAIISVASLFWNAAVFSCPVLRRMSLQYSGSRQAAKACTGLCRNPGNWYILHILSTNMTPSYFLDLMEPVLHNHFDNKCRPLYESRFGRYARKHMKVTDSPTSKTEDEKKDSKHADEPSVTTPALRAHDGPSSNTKDSVAIHVPRGEWDGKINWDNLETFD